MHDARIITGPFRGPAELPRANAGRTRNCSPGTNDGMRSRSTSATRSNCSQPANFVILIRTGRRA